MKAPRTIELRWSEEPSWCPVQPRLWRLRTPLLRIQRKTESGVECFNLREGVLTDFRSGGLFVDLVVPHVRNETEGIVWTLHDMGYTGFSPSRIVCDEWLYSDLLAAGYSKLRAGIVYRGVRMGGAANYSDEPTRECVERKYWGNLDLIRHTVLHDFTLDITCCRLVFPTSA